MDTNKAKLILAGIQLVVIIISISVSVALSLDNAASKDDLGLLKERVLTLENTMSYCSGLMEEIRDDLKAMNKKQQTRHEELIQRMSRLEAVANGKKAGH